MESNPELPPERAEQSYVAMKDQEDVSEQA